MHAAVSARPPSDDAASVRDEPSQQERGSQPVSADAPTSLLELARLFFRLGTTAFGGPAAHIAMLREEVVTKRGWMSEARFLDLLGATQLIPGPNSTEMAIHVGFDRRGWAGLVVAGVAFIAPAMAITWACAAAYVTWGALPEVGWIFYGVQPVILAIVLKAIVGLAPTAVRTTPQRIAGVVLLALALAAFDPLVLMLASGLFFAVLGARTSPPSTSSPSTSPPSTSPPSTSPPTTSPPSTSPPTSSRSPSAEQWLPILGTSAAGGAISASSIFWVFLKIGSVLFGSGYVLLAFLRADLVEQRGWLTEDQLLDAIAVGQVTPGPVFTTVTFIGYVLAGHGGAAAATLGIFVPAFVFVALSGPLVPRIRANPRAGAFLDGVNVASLALMASVTLELGAVALIDLPTVALAVLAAVLTIRFQVGSTWLLALGALVGVLARLLGT